MSVCASLLAASDGGTADAYRFPVLPGTAAWKALENHDAMIAATQVPAGILSAMSTAGVVETCLTHPLLIDLWAHNSPQAGFNGATRWNVIQELLARPDAGQELLLRYTAVDPATRALTATPPSHAALASSIAEMELIFAQEPILRSLTRAQRFDLLRAAVRMAAAKTRHLDSSHLEYTAFLAARTLEEDDLLTRGAARSPAERLRVRAFLRSGFGADDALVQRVVDLARKTVEAPQAAAGPSTRTDVELRLQQPSKWPSDRPIRRPLTLSLVNRGADPVFVSPAMGQIAGTLEILMRPRGSMDAPMALYSTLTAFAGYAFDDLFRLMPRRRVSQTFWVQFHPVFSGEGAIELWAEYDASEMARGDPRAFAGRLRSETIVVPIARSEPIVGK